MRTDIDKGLKIISYSKFQRAIDQHTGNSAK